MKSWYGRAILAVLALAAMPGALAQQAAPGGATLKCEGPFAKDSSHAKLVEAKASGPTVISTLRKQIPGLIAVDPRGDMVARARAVAPEHEAGKFYLPSAAGPHRQTARRREGRAQAGRRGRPADRLLQHGQGDARA